MTFAFNQTGQPGNNSGGAPSSPDAAPGNASPTPGLEQGESANVPNADMQELIRRQVQSQFDKFTAAFEKKFTQQPAAPAQPQQPAQTEPTAKTEQPAQTEGEPQPAEGTISGQTSEPNPGQGEGGSAAEGDPIQKSAEAILKRYGVDDIPADAPEYKLINQETADPYEFLESVRQAAETLAKRKQIETNNTPARLANLGMGGKGGETAPTQPIDDFKTAYKPK